ncbi:TPA: autotransporter domain-containing protein [Pseudomonas aeruginosa]|uniref:autotransporter serine peptidase EprS n=1 Tax=Pseudomonas aeruginosa TaxID=287 RepID=UPI000FC414BB|nr:autotransporter domain-containing protein [Pseudomonas aeruginosa]RUD91956.1 autotransporter domain-containing protein [Pseudomonas aeruginosa]HBP0230792.1 autotransporter domain-containing protein [Pseudomonas aeruginosa]HBP0653134.1 autotransporter domain-containing protein [Pseudomonas aeruginosa]HBP1029507.1 autotransporter domain-containing protein [Pseudomonas aeruginosa]HBP1410722.1 autotransporter domain-containing protein [Pseudomonas aeruginosa]
MTDDHSFRPRPTSLSAALLLGAWIAQPATAAYVEAGRPGDPASWRSAEYQQDWGLERMRADQAYAAGIDGQGVKIGEMDSGFDPSHPDTPASRYQPVTASGTYVDGTPFSVSGAMNGNNDSHGTHVGGTLGASRDGVGMHGVAYAAQVYVANTNQNDSFLFGPTPDPNYFKAAYQALADAGVRAINNSWGSQPKDVSYETLDGLHAAYAQHYGRSSWLDAAAGVSRQGVINVFSAGNSGYANASVRSALPYFQPDLEGHWLAVSGLDQQNGQRYNRCGIAKYWCITTPGRLINSTMPGGGYANKSGTSMAAPHATGALALVMQRYPYLNNEQALQVLLTTATQLDGTPTGAPTDTVGWGVPDLGRAMHGPGQLLGRFEANLPAGLRDEWSNPISDSALLQRQAEDAAEHAAWQRTLKDKGWENGLPAGASQQERTDYAIGMARDQAAAQRQYQGSLVKAGAGSLVLSGDSTYRGPTLVDGGLLSVDGSLLSAVEVNAGGTLGGSGRIGGLLARSGGTVAAGNSIGTLEVAGDLRFESGSTYAVELSESASDRIVASGKASIAGGNVTLAMENSPDLLSQSQVESLVGRRYDILDAAGGIDGRFDAVLPNYLFLGGTLDYAANAIRLDIGRNGTTLASVAQTPNQAAVAGAVETLGAGNPVYESLLLSENAATAQRTFQQLSGEIYPALAGLLLNDSRYLRDSVGERLRQASDGEAGGEAPEGWFKALGSWGKSADGSHGSEGYRHSVGGFLLGVDSQVASDTRLGLVAGYSNSSLNMDSSLQSSASIDSYHLGAYLGRQLQQWRLSLGAAHTWHRAEVKRDLQYGAVARKQKAKLDAQSSQLFAEAAYALGWRSLELEPFAGLAYVHVASDDFRERGSAAALEGGDDNLDAAFTTLGLRAKRHFELDAGRRLALSGTLGWRHNLSDTTPQRHLAFASGSQPFSVESVALSRDAALLGVDASLAVNREVSVRLGYNGLLGSREKDHGVGLAVDWRF